MTEEMRDMTGSKIDTLSRGDAFELSEDLPTNPSTAPTFGDVVDRRLGRRQTLRGLLAVTVLSALGTGGLLGARARPSHAGIPGFKFQELAAGIDENHHVAPGYKAEVLIRWGDPVRPGSPDFDPANQTTAAQLQQFGYNCDYIGYLPLPLGSDNAEHGLLFVNHEYTNEELMFPGLARQDKNGFADMTKDLVDIEMAAHGASIIEVAKREGAWQVVSDSRYARRISALHSEMRLAGPAAGHARLKTSRDPSGTRVMGTINNCAGGTTPWGTFLTAEENFHGYFWNEAALSGHPEERNFTRYGLPGGWYNWGQHHDRFDIGKEPNEANRFGWMVEVDPLDPASTPIKRTALGRFKHEGAEVILNPDGRVVCYMGDDQRFDYVYRFVSHGRLDPNGRRAGRDLLDSGTLSVARFDADGTLTWMPLVFGTGPLTPENDFESQADVLIETRRAADLLGATPMDRPEDVQPNAATGKVYVMLTNNSKRAADDTNVANPRGPNPFGHIVEMTAPGGDHAAHRFSWDILVKCGDPKNPRTGAIWGLGTTQNGWFQAPDNAAVDPEGRLWVATDGNKPGSHSNRCDGLWAMETEGELRGTGIHFFRAPIGAEVCGPKFTPDGRTLFVAVQHPADAGAAAWTPFGRASTFEDPATRWPDFKAGVPPRPSVVVITKDDGGVIGS
jgi:secreted PhoX family phosphatase